MSGWQLAVTAVLYLWVAIDCLRQGQMGLALAWAAYALANAGFIAAARGL